MPNKYPKGPFEERTGIRAYLGCLLLIAAAVIVVWLLSSCGPGASARPTPTAIPLPGTETPYIIARTPTGTPATNLQTRRTPVAPPPLPTRVWTRMPTVPTVPTSVPTVPAALPTAVGTAIGP